MRFKIKIITIGKIKDRWLEEALGEYEKRLSYAAQIEWVLVKNDEQLVTKALENTPFISLDPEGKEYDSPRFAHFLSEQRVKFSFVIGGAEGLPVILKERARQLMSLSKMTLTHQMCRLLLLEQIYRGFEINRNSPYHK